MGEEATAVLVSIARLLLLILLAFACKPFADFTVRMALLFSHPSLLGLIVGLLLALACSGTAIVGAWILLSIYLKIWPV